jgi:hypothetical protein
MRAPALGDGIGPGLPIYTHLHSWLLERLVHIYIPLFRLSILPFADNSSAPSLCRPPPTVLHIRAPAAPPLGLPHFAARLRQGPWPLVSGAWSSNIPVPRRAPERTGGLKVLSTFTFRDVSLSEFLSVCCSRAPVWWSTGFPDGSPYRYMHPLVIVGWLAHQRQQQHTEKAASTSGKPPPPLPASAAKRTPFPSPYGPRRTAKRADEGFGQVAVVLAAAFGLVHSGSP